MTDRKKLQFSFWQTVSFVLLAVLLVIVGTKRLSGFKSLNLTAILGQPKFVAMTPAQLKTSLAMPKKDFVLVNVHTPYEGEIAKTDFFIRYDEVAQHQSKLPSDRTAKIILYCKGGEMSREAAKKLAELGYTNIYYLAGGTEAWEKAGEKMFDIERLKKSVLPKEGFALPIKWGDLGPRLVSLGVIDLKKFTQAVNPSPAQLAILQGNVDEPISIDETSSQFAVDMLWAIGLAQKSLVYTDGPMGTTYKKEVGNFASTGGWVLAKGNAVNYLNKYQLVDLTPEQQGRVYEISKNVFRPCCGNPTSFPDCNHGMAALALVELMVSKNYSDEEIYWAALKFNSFWFPQNYLQIAAQYALKGISWDKVNAKEVLSQTYSSSQGAGAVAQDIGSLPYLFNKGKGGCGV